MPLLIKLGLNSAGEGGGSRPRARMYLNGRTPLALFA